MNLTRHAQVRTQQRAIPQLVIDLLVRFGAEEPSYDRTVIMYFDKSARKRLERHVGRGAVSCLSKYLQAYLVLGDNGRVVTVGHRHRRIQTI